MNTELSMGVVRGVLTLLLMLAFIGMVIYVYSKRNKSIYDQAARLPLEDASVVNAVMNKESSGSPQS
jgi:cytochrome c oxidase cbb3-type subunit 4